MELGRYTQIGIVVHDLEQSMKKWLGLGAGPFYLFDASALPEREYRGKTGFEKIRSAHAFLGQTQIELIQPTSDEPSMFREVLDVKGEGTHHLQLDCGVITPDDFDAAHQRYTGMGYELVQKWVIPGIGRITFYDALNTLGYFFELAERSPLRYQSSVEMYEAHIGWEGTNPYRSNEIMQLAAAEA